jgi:hypothetical protein
MPTLRRIAFFLLALPVIVRAASRCARWERRLPLDELAPRLRDTARFASPRLANPPWLLASLDRVLPLLPPWRYGPCLKRSLLLLDLWSRCGLHPRLHLGVRRAGESRHEGHAWVTVEDGAFDGPRSALVELAPATSAHGYAEAFVF